MEDHLGKLERLLGELERVQQQQAAAVQALNDHLQRTSVAQLKALKQVKRILDEVVFVADTGKERADAATLRLEALLQFQPENVRNAVEAASK